MLPEQHHHTEKFYEHQEAFPIHLIIDGYVNVLKGSWSFGDETHFGKASFTDDRIDLSCLARINQVNYLLLQDDMPYITKVLQDVANDIETNYAFRVVDGEGMIKVVRGKVSGNHTYALDVRAFQLGSWASAQEAGRKRAAQESSKNFEILQQSEVVAEMGSWEFILDKNEFKWSDGMYKLFDLPFGYPVTPEMYCGFMIPEDAQLAKMLLSFFREAHTPIEMIIRVAVADDLKYLKVKGLPMKSDSNKIERLIGINLDISFVEKSRRELKALNESLQEKNAELNSVNRELGNFAFITSHDLREPLRKIKTFCNLLVERELRTVSATGREYFTKIIKAVERMNALIDDVLMFSRVSAKSRPDFIEVDLNKVLEGVLSDLSELIREHHVMIACDKLPVMYGHPLQLSQLFQNLIVNAIKFQPSGNIPFISIHATVVNSDKIDSFLTLEGKRYLELKFADNGIGFDNEFGEKIFQMFQRLHSQREYQGTGMGLAICKRVVENHRGFMTANGSPGNGSEFYCYFPLDR